MITILSQPQELTPGYNDVTYVLTDTLAASANFRFVTVIKDGSGNQVGKLKAPVLNGEAKGVAMVQRIIENFVSYEFDLTNTLAYFPSQNAVFNYEVEFGHEVSGVETLNEVNDTGFIWNACFGRREFASYASGEWTLDTGATGVKFLTNQRSKRIRKDQWDWLYFIEFPAPLAFFVDYAKYKSYAADGTLLKTVDVTYAGGLIGSYWMGRIPSGRNTSEIGSVLSGTLPVVDTAAAYYTVAMYDNNGNRLTEEFPLTLVNECTWFEPVELFYLNSLGGFDSFMFDMASTSSVEPTQKQMHRQVYELSGNNYARNLNKHELVNYDTKHQPKARINSDWITQAEAEALKELRTSPVIFYYLNDEYIPVTLSQGTWEVKTEMELYNCSVEIVFDLERRQGA